MSDANLTDRPGVHPRWLAGWKATRRNSEEWFQADFPRRLQRLQHYADTGLALPSAAQPVPFEAVTPPWRSWERAVVGREAWFYALGQLWAWERSAAEADRPDSNLAASMLDAAELEMLIAADSHRLFPVRYPGRALQSMLSAALYFTAADFVMGDSERAARRARLQLQAIDRGYFDLFGFKPTSAFIARLLADFSGRPQLPLRGDSRQLQKGEIAADPIYDALLGVWRAPDASTIIPQCLAACDVHTHLAFPGANSPRREFASIWSRTPLAVWLVFRLRQLSGLAVPVFEHPLMEVRMPSAPAQRPAFDPLLGSVVARMRSDGFNEEEVVQAYR